VDVDVDLIGWVGVGLEGTYVYVCSCGILYAAMLGVVFYGGWLVWHLLIILLLVLLILRNLSARVFLVHIHIHTQLPTNPLTSHQFSLTIARRIMMRSQHHHAV